MKERSTIKIWRSVAFVWLFFFIPACMASVDMDREKLAMIRDSFTGGKPELEWRPYPFFHQDNLKGDIDRSSPEGEPGIGVLNNGTAGGFAALSYTETLTFGDFYFEAWIYVQATEKDKGPLNGIAFRVDPMQDRYYRFSAHFSADPSLSLAYVGKDTNHFPGLFTSGKGLLFRRERSRGAAGIASRSKYETIKRKSPGIPNGFPAVLFAWTASIRVTSVCTRPAPAGEGLPRPRSMVCGCGASYFR